MNSRRLLIRATVLLVMALGMWGSPESARASGTTECEDFASEAPSKVVRQAESCLICWGSSSCPSVEQTECHCTVQCGAGWSGAACGEFERGSHPGCNPGDASAEVCLYEPER
jgi:hypothetical protein